MPLHIWALGLLAPLRTEIAQNVLYIIQKMFQLLLIPKAFIAANKILHRNSKLDKTI